MKTFSAFLWNVAKRWDPKIDYNDPALNDSVDAEVQVLIPKRNQLEFFNDPKGKILSCHLVVIH